MLSFFLPLLFTSCDLLGSEDNEPPRVARSSITLPDRRATDAERNAWINDYRRHGGPTATELEVIKLINVVRMNHKLQTVQMDRTLMMAARYFAQQRSDIKPTHNNYGTNTHNWGPYATNNSAQHGASANVAAAFGGRLRWNGGNWYSSGSLSASFLVNGWMNSPGHRAYILSPEHRYIGVGHFPGGISYMYLSNRASVPNY